MFIGQDLTMTSHEAYLRSALAKYQYADITKRDILSAFQQYTDLRPNLDTFTFNDGTQKEFLCLTGTIPVSYKGSTYNIPVSLWIQDTHPYNPPMAYVKPTNTMQIKPGRHVDANGRVYLPYLHEWKHPQSDLLGLIQIMTIIFGEEPPVYSRSAGAPVNRPPAPYNAQGAHPPAGNMPYASAGSGMPVPAYPNSGYPSQNSAGYQPPYPPPASTGYNPSTGFYPQQQSSTYSTPYPQTGAQTYSSTNVGSGTTSTSANMLSDEQIRASLLSAVEDKMRRRLKDIFGQSQAEMDALKKTQEDLQKGKRTLEDMLQKLEREQNEVEQNISLLRVKTEEITDVLQKMDNKEEVNIDDAVVPTTPLYRQLLTAFAEEQATEDALYYLQEGLRRNVIELDVMLKQVRELSRKQFMLRALIHKCRQKAGLPDLSDKEGC